MCVLVLISFVNVQAQYVFTNATLLTAVDYYNEVINASPPATLLDFVRGEVVGDQVYMTVSFQAIIEAIQAGGLEE